MIDKSSHENKSMNICSTKKKKYSNIYFSKFLCIKEYDSYIHDKNCIKHLKKLWLVSKSLFLQTVSCSLIIYKCV